MAQLTGDERGRYVQGMFGRIAARYDLMNRLMTGGMDVRWRALLLEKAALQAGDRLLDLGTGTGDIAIAARHSPAAQIVGADFTLPMMQVGQQRPNTAHIRWAAADALNLPFASGYFNATVSGFLLRNVGDLPRALREQRRVLAPGGRFVALDSTPPPDNVLRPFIDIHLRYVIPTLGRLLTGDGDAYAYLPDTTVGFVPAEQLADMIADAGFQSVGFKRLMFGAVALHWGVNPG